MTADITKLVTLILGISISGERLVTLLKTIIPSLAAPPASAGDQATNPVKAIAKKIVLMVIAFLCCYLCIPDQWIKQRCGRYRRR